MAQGQKAYVIPLFVALLAFVVVSSILSVNLWGEKPEEIPEAQELVIQETMTIEEFGKSNALSSEVLKEVFGLTSKEELQQTIQQKGLSAEEIADHVKKAAALEAEHESKSWMKIAAKFILWAAFLLYVFFLLKNGKVTPQLRKWLLFAAVVLFGVVLGADPSPMGTVKDAIVLFGKSGAIFPPRLIAFLLMLIGGIVLANKFLCSWGCQFGTLQDLIFRFNRDAKDRKGLFPQYKIPFQISNAIRIVFFVVLTLVAFIWATDIVEDIDPFKIFKPAVLGTMGIIFIGVVLIASLFVYRPWCHLFCPFGLVGWLAEKVSWYKIKVDYETCTACEACSKACPSNVMEAILKRDQTIPDCFACGNCIDVCPVNAIHFQSGKRSMPPEGKFKK